MGIECKPQTTSVVDYKLAISVAELQRNGHLPQAPVYEETLADLGIQQAIYWVVLSENSSGVADEENL